MSLSTLAPAGDAGDDHDRHSTPVERFNSDVVQELLRHRVAVPHDLVTALESDRLLPWERYATMLFELPLSLMRRQSFHRKWNRHAAHGGQVRTSPDGGRDAVPPSRDSAPERRDPALAGLRPIQNSELQATTEQEFVALLRTIGERSGLSVPSWAARAGVAKSQIYSLFKRKKLPVKAQQVQALVMAAGLPTDQVRHVMGLWGEIREAKTRPPRPVQFDTAYYATMFDTVAKSFALERLCHEPHNYIDVIPLIMTESCSNGASTQSYPDLAAATFLKATAHWKVARRKAHTSEHDPEVGLVPSNRRTTGDTPRSSSIDSSASDEDMSA